MTGNHGHVYPNADGSKARCGGPCLCSQCALDFARKHYREGGASNAMTDTPTNEERAREIACAHLDDCILLNEYGHSEWCKDLTKQITAALERVRREERERILEKLCVEELYGSNPKQMIEAIRSDGGNGDG